MSKKCIFEIDFKKQLILWIEVSINTNYGAITMKEADVDYNLAVRFLNGDTQGWDQLYNKSNEIVTGYTKKYLWSLNLSAISEDVISEAYSRAYEKLNTFKGNSRFSTWVCGIVKRIIWGENSEYKRKKNFYQTYVFSQVTFYSRDPCDIILESELYKSLWGAFEKLQPIEAYILENHVIHGQTFFELSRVMNLPTRIVKKCYQKALDKFSKNFHCIRHIKKYD